MKNNNNNNYSTRFVMPTNSEIEKLINKNQVSNILSKTQLYGRVIRFSI
jgi:hypothetical protein